MFLRITCAAVVALGVAVPQTLRADTTISLHDAVRQGKVQVDVNGLGGATRPWVRVEVQRLGGEKLQLEVAPGTILPPSSHRGPMTRSVLSEECWATRLSTV